MKTIKGIIIFSLSNLILSVINSYCFAIQNPLTGSSDRSNYIEVIENNQCSIISTEKVKWSGLSGYMVGPSAKLHFSNPKSKILRPFLSDLCSSSPSRFPFTSHDQDWAICCIEHDLAYWKGGTEDQRINADIKLRACMESKGFPQLGKFYEYSVNKFGGPESENNYRWGFGWNYKRPYSPLTKEELNLSNQLINSNITLKKQFDGTPVFSVINRCEIFDPIFNKISDDEIEAYNFLNLNLKSDKLIIWAKWGYFNLELREFEVKLKDCDQIVKVVFYKDAPKDLKIISTCDL